MHFGTQLGIFGLENGVMCQISACEIFVDVLALFGHVVSDAAP